MSRRRYPGCDPLRHAAAWVCDTCGARCWPVEAAWLDDERILASYAGCAHVEGVARVIGPGAPCCEAEVAL